MKTTATVSSKGQITLPVEFRRKNDLIDGGEVKISWNGNVMQLEKDDYKERLAKNRAMAKKHMESNGTWGMSWEQARRKSEQARVDYYKDKDGSSN